MKQPGFNGTYPRVWISWLRCWKTTTMQTFLHTSFWQFRHFTSFWLWHNIFIHVDIRRCPISTTSLYFWTLLFRFLGQVKRDQSRLWMVMLYYFLLLWHNSLMGPFLSLFTNASIHFFTRLHQHSTIPLLHQVGRGHMAEILKKYEVQLDRRRTYCWW